MKSKKDSSYIAFLRAINVGGHNKLPMKDLAAIFVAAGCAEVQTYIQSGNVICKAHPSIAKDLPAVVSSAILERFGYRIPVVTRTAGELLGIAHSNPFLVTSPDPDTLHVAFLADVPSAAAVGALDTHRSPPDEFVVRGREIYLRFPQGVARTKLTNAYFEAKLATTSTVRNWRTLLKLLDLTSSA